MQQVREPEVQEENIAAQLYRFTVDDFYKMAEVGIFTDDDRVELIEGNVFEMSPIGSRHANVVDLLTEWFSELASTRQATVRVQGPIYLDERSEVIPDVMLLRRRSNSRAPHPTASEVLLVVEVAHSTIASDRSKKVPLYANAELPELWIVDLMRDVVEVYTHPAEGQYDSLQTYRSGQRLAPQAFPSLVHDVDDLFQ